MSNVTYPATTMNDVSAERAEVKESKRVHTAQAQKD